MAEGKDIALRSEKVCNIVGRIPPAVDRYGIAVIGIVILAVVAVSMIVPYKETVRFPLQFDPEYSATVGQASLDARQVGVLHVGMAVTVDVFHEVAAGKVVSVSEKSVNGKYQVRVELSGGDEITESVALEATAVVMEKSWFEKLFGKVL